MASSLAQSPSPFGKACGWGVDVTSLTDLSPPQQSKNPSCLWMQCQRQPSHATNPVFSSWTSAQRQWNTTNHYSNIRTCFLDTFPGCQWSAESYFSLQSMTQKMLRAVVLEQGMFSPAGLAFLLMAFQTFWFFHGSFLMGIRRMPNRCLLLGQDHVGLASYKATVMNQKIRFLETIKMHCWG